MEFTKHDNDKVDYSLLPVEALEAIAEVMQHGAEKYERDNWKKCTDTNRYYAALLRHLFAWKRGEMVDPDSGLPHLSHMACNAVFLMEIDKDTSKLDFSKRIAPGSYYYTATRCTSVEEN